MKALLLMAATIPLFAQTDKIRIIAFGAHPDDCEIRAAGIFTKRFCASRL